MHRSSYVRPLQPAQHLSSAYGRLKSAIACQAASLVLIVWLFCGLQAQAQEKTLSIELRRLPIDLQMQAAYIAEVQDARPEKGPIGTSNKGLKGRMPIVLRGGLDTCIYTYLYWTLPRDTSKTPVIMEVNQLMVSEQYSNMYEKGLLHMEVSFYKKADSTEARTLLHVAKVALEGTGPGAAGSHATRIREALTLALTDFNKTWNGTTTELPYQELEGAVFSDSALGLPRQTYADTLPRQVLGTTYGADGRAVAGDTLLEERSRISVMLTGYAQVSVRAEGYGGSFYFFQSTPQQNWMFPLVLTLERFSIRPDYLVRNDFGLAELSYAMPGFTAFRKLSGPFHLGLSVMVPFGDESLVSLSTGRVLEYGFWGLNTGQGIYILPTNNAGLAFGIRAFQWFSTSRVYNNDFGVRFEAGIKF